MDFLQQAAERLRQIEALARAARLRLVSGEATSGASALGRIEVDARDLAQDIEDEDRREDPREDPPNDP